MLPRYTCRRCFHKWTPNIESPKRCPACKRLDWNPSPLSNISALTETEYAAMLWIAKENNVSTDEVFKQIGSPDFVLKNGKSYEVKRLMGRAAYISQLQLSNILKSNPDCLLLVFKPGCDYPIVNIPVSEIMSEEILDTVDISKYGQIYIKVTGG